MNVRHLMVPGLSSADIERGALRGLIDSGTSRARLVSSFPPTVAAQEATLLTGAPPSHHGVLFPDDAPRVPSLIDAWHERLDTLVDGGGFEVLEPTLRKAVDEAEVVLVSGCPTTGRPEWVVDPVPAAPHGFRLRLDDTFALCEPVAGSQTLPEGFVDACLRTPGIERVLAPTPESAGAWMAPPDRGWILVAEQGWAFRAVRAGAPDGSRHRESPCCSPLADRGLRSGRVRCTTGASPPPCSLWPAKTLPLASTRPSTVPTRCGADPRLASGVGS